MKLLYMLYWTPKQKKVLDSIIYEFNQSKAIAIYEKIFDWCYYTKIPVGTVIIHGHTDIGEETYNQNLSLLVQMMWNIIENSLSKAVEMMWNLN
jgi:hypothetical protein